MSDIVLSPQIGQGFAQVFDTRAYAQDAIRNMQYHQQIEQRNAQKLAELLNSPKADGLRVQDIPVYNDKVKEWRSIYLNNPRLYSNPASNYEAYNRAQQLKNEIDMMPKVSRQYQDSALTLVKHIADNRDKYDDDSVEKADQLMKASTFEGMQMLGGKLPNPLDFQQIPQPPDLKPIFADVDQLASRMPDGKKSVFETMKFDGKNGVPEGRIKQREITEYNPVAITTAVANHMDSNMRRYYEGEFKKQDPLAISRLQEQLDNTLGDQSFTIRDAKDYAMADITLKLRQKDLGWKESDDEEYKRKQKDIDRQQRLQDNLMLEGVRNKHNKENILLRHNLSGKEKEEEDMKIVKHVDLLSKRLTGGAKMDEIVALTSNLQQSILGLDDKIRLIARVNPQTGQEYSLDQFKSMINSQRDGESRKEFGGAALSDKDIEALYNSKTPVLTMKWSDSKTGAKKVFFFDPRKVSSKGAMIGFIRGAGAGSNKQGFVRSSVEDNYTE